MTFQAIIISCRLGRHPIEPAWQNPVKVLLRHFPILVEHNTTVLDPLWGRA